MPLKLSERWAFARADAQLLNLLLDFAEDEPFERHDLIGQFGTIMDDRPVGTLEGLTLHSRKARIVQSEPRGCLRTIDVLAQSVKLLVEARTRRGAENYLMSVAMARCLPFYFGVKMLEKLGAKAALRLRFFSQLLDAYQQTSQNYELPFVPALNRSVQAPYARYRELVELTCSAYSTLWDVHCTKRPARFRRFPQKNEGAVFILRFPLQNDLHYTFTHVVRRRARSLDFTRSRALLRDADSLAGLLDRLLAGA